MLSSHVLYQPKIFHYYYDKNTVTYNTGHYGSM